MKKNYLFALAMAAAFASCSDDNDSVVNPAESEVGTGKGYVALGINLPTTIGSTRANDQFSDGLTEEYAVKNATLILFSGADESTATISAAYEISTEPWQTNSDEQISVTSTKVVQEVSGLSNAQALVVLNHNNVFTVSDGALTVGTENVVGKTLNEFLKLSSATKSKTLHENGFYMANAPLANKPGGTSDPTDASVTTLVPITVYESKAAAEAATPAEIYVERATAKVTLSSTASTLTNNSSVSYEVTEWAIDNYNTETFLVRSTEGISDWLGYATNASTVTDKYRFVGSNDVETNNKSYRTYFAKDVNYGDEADGTTVPTLTTLPESMTYNTAFGEENPAYCYENTFNVDNQKDNQTTRVIIKAKLNSGNTFYLVNGDKTTLYTEETLKAKIIGYYMNDVNMNAWLVANHKEGTDAIAASDFTVTLTTTGATTTFTIADASSLADKLVETAVGERPTVDLSNSVKIVCYQNGISYYTVKIKHFGDDLTPWGNGETVTPSATDIYPSANADKNYLGRYGVLRNNWYDIKVTGIRNIGDAETPVVTGDWDDEKEAYVVCRINVLSWAKRQQSVEL